MSHKSAVIDAALDLIDGLLDELAPAPVSKLHHALTIETHETLIAQSKQRKFTRTLVTFFEKEGESAAMRVRAVMRKMRKDKTDTEADIDKIVDAAVDGIAWADIIDEAEEAIYAGGEAGHAVGLAQLPSVRISTNFVENQQLAQAYAHDRAAELVGMKYDSDGNLVENPNPKWAISDTTRDMIRRDVETAFAEETKISDLTKVIQESNAFSKSRAQMVSATEVNRAQSVGTFEAWQKTGLVKKVKWVLSSLHNTEEPDECLLGDTIIQARGVTRAFRRMYTGKVVQVQLESGHKLTGTPNHPILTDMGWKPLKSINQGDNVLTGDGLKRSGVIADDFYDMKASAHNLFRSFQGTSTTIETVPRDFHGDGSGSDIHIVTTAKQSLRYGVRESAVNSVIKDLLAFTLASCPSFASDWASDVSRTGLSLSLLSSHFGATIQASFLDRPERVAVSLESSHNSHAANHGDPSNFGSGHLAIKVQPSHLDSSRAGAFHYTPTNSVETYFVRNTPVFNFTCDDGFFVANNFVTHNCDENAAIGPIEFGTPFPSGDLHPGAHPACRCSLAISEVKKP